MIKTSKVETIIWVWPQIVTAEVAGFHKWVWFGKATLTNIFAFHEMEVKYRITNELAKEKAFHVRYSDKFGNFKKAPTWLLAYNPDTWIVGLN